eukprot:m.111200 g.111200  ORF g.111200 m.111200 type:complete len:532 (+) comp15378_c0_seq1:360-1955(+)
MDVTPDAASAIVVTEQPSFLPSHLPCLPPKATYQPNSPTSDEPIEQPSQDPEPNRPTYTIQTTAAPAVAVVDDNIPAAALCPELSIQFDTALLLAPLPAPTLVPLLPEFAKARRRVFTATAPVKQEPDEPMRPPSRRAASPVVAKAAKPVRSSPKLPRSPKPTTKPTRPAPAAQAQKPLVLDAKPSPAVRTQPSAKPAAKPAAKRPKTSPPKIAQQQPPQPRPILPLHPITKPKAVPENRLKRRAEAMPPLDVKKAKQHAKLKGKGDGNTPSTPKLLIKFGSKDTSSKQATPAVLATALKEKPGPKAAAPAKKRKPGGKRYTARDVIVYPHPNADDGPWCVCNSCAFEGDFMACEYCEQWYHPACIRTYMHAPLCLCPVCDAKLELDVGLLRHMLTKYLNKKLTLNRAYMVIPMTVKDVFEFAPVQLPGYLKVVKNKPMDLSTMFRKLDLTEQGAYGGYRSIKEFIEDINTIVGNCRLYNDESTPGGNRALGFQQYYLFADEFGALMQRELKAMATKILAKPGVPPKKGVY